MAVHRRGRSWLVTVELGKDPTTGRRRRVFLTVPTRKEAEQEEARLRHEAATGLDLEPGRVTVAEYIERWLGAIRPNLAPATYLRYQGLLRHQVLPHIGSVSLAKLRPLHVQQLYARLRESGRVDGTGGLSPRSLVHVHRVLFEALGQAVRWQLVPRNACQAVEAPQAGRLQVRGLSRPEAQRLIQVAECEGGPLGVSVILGLHTGLRLGEILGLKWEDVDLNRGQLMVRRALQYLPGRGLTLREPKTGRSRRTIPLGRTVVETLSHVRRGQLEERLAAGQLYVDSGLVFADPLGSALPPYRISQKFRSLARQAGLEGLRFHDLRHGHATLLLARGVHPKVVSERLGHAGVSITLDVYSHVLPTLQEEAARDLDAWLSGQAQ